MAAGKRMDQIRAQLEKLRKDSLDMVVSANKIVYQGVQRVADLELKALNDTYRAALDSLKKARKSDNLKDAAGQQIDALQDAVNRIIASARKAMKIVAETRHELTQLMQKSLKGGTVTRAEIERSAQRAQKAVTEARDSARKAAKDVVSRAAKAVNKQAARVSPPAKPAARKASKGSKATKPAAKKSTKSGAKKPAKPAPRAKSVVADGVASLMPSPNSRASRATSRAKQAAEKAVSAAGEAVSAAVEAASETLKSR